MEDPGGVVKACRVRLRCDDTVDGSERGDAREGDENVAAAVVF